MDFFSNLSLAFRVCLEPTNFLMCFIGVFIGTLVGVLPGLGASATIALLFPITFQLSPAHSIIMLAGIYYGANYGGSTTSILLNIPGESTTMITCLDGYQMARKGRAGAALGIAAIGSFIGGTFGVIMTTLMAPPLARMALEFGPPEYASLICVGLIMVVYLSTGSMTRSLMMACVGLLLGCIGSDILSGTIRFWGGIPELTEGLGVVSLLMGLFGVSEVLLNVETTLSKREIFETQATQFKDLLPNKEERKDSTGPVLRGTILGFFIGLLPGGGGLLASILSYALEKRISKHPERFGTGYIKGVAGPETANNSGAQGSYIPLLTLGIPGNVAMAMLLGAFLIHGIPPGPLLLKNHPALFWGVIGSMYVGNVMLLVLNLPLIGIWIRVLRVPYVLLFPIILLVCLIGSYTVDNNVFDIYIMIIFGVLGYLMKKFDYPAAPLILAYILGPMLEKNLNQAVMMAGGNFSIFFVRPMSVGLLAVAFFLLVSPVVLRRLKRRRPGLLIKEGDDIS
jgi:putative tricarboxylic transport membrane protein